MIDWTKEVPYAITVSDADGNILDMNDLSLKTFLPPCETSIIGRNLREFHPEHARIKLESMLENHHVNAYTIEKNGIRKLVYQAP